MRQDIRYALRVMGRSRAFTAVAVLSLALGIGANTAIFSLIDTLMLRMLPVEHPEQLVEMLHQFPQPGEPRMNGYPLDEVEFFRTHNHVFSALLGHSDRFPRIHVRTNPSDPQPGEGEFVDGNFFPVLGVKPAIGRLIDTGTTDGVVLGWSYWKSRFHLDPGAVGKRIYIDDVPLTVIGVAARDFAGVQVGVPKDAWVPFPMESTVRHLPPADGRQGRQLELIGRLKPGATLDQARAEMTLLFRQYGHDEVRTSNNTLAKLRFDVERAGAGESILRDQYGKPLVVLMAVVGLLLLIACTNVASMMLARGAGRQREMALRVSLGAGRWRLLRQVLTESVLMSVAGTLLGVFLAFVATRVLVRVIETARDPVVLQVTPDLRVLLFTAAIALATGVLFGLVPALQAMRTAPASALRDGGRAGETRMGRLFGKGLVVAQVALSIVLLSAAGLFVRHLEALRGPDLGFHPDHVLLLSLDPAASGYDRDRLAQAYEQLLPRLEGIPGVRAASITAVSPIRGMGAGRAVTVEGYTAKPGERRNVSLNWVAPRYFETMGQALVMGRDFNAQDEGRPLVAIVSQTMARYYFGDANPLGRHIQFDGRQGSYEVIGVAADAKYSDVHEPMVRVMYLDTFQDRASMQLRLNLALRTGVDPNAMGAQATRVVRDSLKTIPVTHIVSLAYQIDQSIIPERLVAMLSGLFGVLGSLLAAIGLYGLLAYTVARRINEIGIRMALGATSRDVTRMVLWDALAMVGVGLAAGVPMTLWGKRFAASVVEGLRMEIAVPVLVGATAMIAIGLVASYVPARRASRVDPMAALRWE